MLFRHNTIALRTDADDDEDSIYRRLVSFTVCVAAKRWFATLWLSRKDRSARDCLTIQIRHCPLANWLLPPSEARRELNQDIEGRNWIQPIVFGLAESVSTSWVWLWRGISLVHERKARTCSPNIFVFLLCRWWSTSNLATPTVRTSASFASLTLIQHRLLIIHLNYEQITLVIVSWPPVWTLVNTCITTKNGKWQSWNDDRRLFNED